MITGCTKKKRLLHDLKPIEPCSFAQRYMSGLIMMCHPTRHRSFKRPTLNCSLESVVGLSEKGGGRNQKSGYYT